MLVPSSSMTSPALSRVGPGTRWQGRVRKERLVSSSFALDGEAGAHRGEGQAQRYPGSQARAGPAPSWTSPRPPEARDHVCGLQAPQSR